MKRIVITLGQLNCGKRVCAVFLLCALATIALPAQTLTTLASFKRKTGSGPLAGLVQTTNGDFYGTTYYGGALNGDTVFKITPSGTLTELHDFCCRDGEGPLGGLVQATNGDLYGTTAFGGVSDGGTVFKITPNGTLTTLYSFCLQSDCLDGRNPSAGLTQDSNGDLYGTTASGGVICQALPACGTVFKITPSGTLTTLHSFCAQANCADGNGPMGALVQVANGELYGTTYLGGPNNAGTVFKITSSGTLTAIYSFCAQANCTDGEYPPAGLVRGAHGDLYGTTFLGGAYSSGTVFQITPEGMLTTLHSFCAEADADCADGSEVYAGLARGTDGNFYGTTSSGGANSEGAVFQITPSGTLTTLYNFCSEANCTDGENPRAGLVQATNGDFYGTTVGNLTTNYGTVFSLSLGLGPFVKSVPDVGAVGFAVEILGTNLTGANAVCCSGWAACQALAGAVL
jgi:uncharacterized repeat protein (TIGR03803 family)